MRRLCHSPANERTSGNGAVALWFHFPRLSRAVPECGRWTFVSMCRLGPLLLCLLVMTGCELVYVVPPASGRVVDARTQQPVASTKVTRVHAEAPAKCNTDAEGRFRFHGKRHLEVALGDPVLSPASYRFEAPGYIGVETNRFHGLWANQKGLRDDFGTIQLMPK
jgi:hypothetical protein